MSGIASKIRNARAAGLLGIVLMLLVGLLYFSRAYGAELPQRSLLLSDSNINTVATYQLSFTIPAPEVLGSIRLLFCSDSPILTDPCTAPAGFDASGVSLTAQSGETGFAVYPSGTNVNTVVLSRVPTAAAAGPVSYTLTGIVNPSAEGTYYARLQTFSSGDASGSENDHGGIAFSINKPIQITTTVPPFLLFCSAVTIGGYDCATASGSYINFGNISPGSTASAESQLLTATNAQNGYNLHIYGSTMTSGNNVIDAVPVADVSRPGTNQFGLNLVANVTPSVGQDPVGPGAASPVAGYNQQDFYKFSSGDLIASASTADDFRKLTASYIINIQKDQPIGVYVSTLTYVCLANF